MASVRAQSAPPGPKANPDYAIVPFDLPKRCAGCGCTSEQKPWGAHMVVLSPDQKTVLQQKPHSSACQECKEAAYAAQVPSRTRWEDLQPSLSDPKKLSTLQNWCALRSGSKAHRFIPQGAKEVRQIGHRWEESYDVLTMTEFQRRFPGTKPSSIPGVRVDTVQNSRGEPEEVILTRGAEPPRLVVYHQVDAQLEDNYLLPSSHLRKEQGSEFWEKLQTKACHAQPQRAPTMEELCHMVRKAGGQVSRPQTTCSQPRGAEAASSSPAETRAPANATSPADPRAPSSSACITTPESWGSWASPAPMRAGPNTVLSDCSGEGVFELLLEDNDCMEEDTPTPPADVLSAPAAKGEGVPPENRQDPAVVPSAAHDDVSGGRRRLRVSTSNPDAPAQPRRSHEPAQGRLRRCAGRSTAPGGCNP